MNEDKVIAPWWLARSLFFVWVGFFVLAIVASIMAFRFFHNG